jgi:hypothetical protein
VRGVLTREFELCAAGARAGHELGDGGAKAKRASKIAMHGGRTRCIWDSRA